MAGFGPGLERRERSYKHASCERLRKWKRPKSNNKKRPKSNNKDNKITTAEVQS